VEILLKRTLMSWFGLLVAIQMLPGIEAHWTSALATAFFLSLIQLTIKPVLLLFTLPVNVLSFGLFTLVINAICLKLAAAFVTGFTIDSFISAILGAFFLSVITLLIQVNIGDN
jgi:putative membrane protein